MTKWIIKLNEFDIQYCTCLSMKVQVLTDFVVECTIFDNNPEEEANDKIKEATTFGPDLTSV